MNEVGLQISAVAQTAFNVIFAIGLNIVPVVHQLRDIVVNIGKTILTVVEYTIESVMQLVSSNWLVSYFFGPIFGNYTSSLNKMLLTMAQNITEIGDEASYLLGNMTKRIQKETIDAMQISFDQMHQDVVRRQLNGTQGRRGRCHLSYASSISLNAMTTLQMYSVSCVQNYRKAVIDGLDLIETAIRLVQLNVVNLVQLVNSSSWHIRLHKVNIYWILFEKN